MIEFNENGLLPAGILNYTYDDFLTQFLENFPESNTRLNILKDFRTLIRAVSQISLPEYIWVDGSFVTSKQNPNDIDFCYFLDYKNLTDDIFNNITSIFNENRGNLKCDPYIAFHIPNSPQNAEEIRIVNNRNYWRGQFGFDRLDNPKGIIQLDKAQINSIVNGGLSDDE